MTTATKTRTPVKTEKAITAAAIISRYDAVDNLANEERRFYAEFVHKFVNGTATDDDKRAAGILARKHEFDLDADTSSLANVTNRIEKYVPAFDGTFDKATTDAWQELEKQVVVRNELIERHAKELASQKQVVQDCQQRHQAISGTQLAFDQLRRDKPHLFIAE